MRILEIIPGFIKRAGAEVFLSNLVKEFVKNQPNDIYLLCFYDKVDASFYPFVESMKDRIFFAHKKLGLDLSASKRVGKIITKLSPNIIHTHLSSIKTMFIGQPCLISRKKIVHTVHNLVENDTYGLPDLSIKKYLLLRKKLHFVGISDKISESIKDFYGRLSKNSIETIYNGVPLEQRNEHYDKKFDFICPARFVEQKNQKLLLTAFSEVLKVFPKATIMFCGDGPLLQDCQELANDLQISESVYFAGAVPNIYSYLAESKYFVLSSLFEGNPISILEAMNVGLPIIAPKVGGIPDVVRDGTDGWLYSASDKKELVDLLMKALSNSPDDIEKISSSEKKRVECFSIEACAKQYMELFESIDKA